MRRIVNPQLYSIASLEKGNVLVKKKYVIIAIAHMPQASKLFLDSSEKREVVFKLYILLRAKIITRISAAFRLNFMYSLIVGSTL